MKGNPGFFVFWVFISFLVPWQRTEAAANPGEHLLGCLSSQQCLWLLGVRVVCSSSFWHNSRTTKTLFILQPGLEAWKCRLYTASAEHFSVLENAMGLGNYSLPVEAQMGWHTARSGWICWISGSLSFIQWRQKLLQEIRLWAWTW
jgi:hypothetical protein